MAAGLGCVWRNKSRATKSSTTLAEISPKVIKADFRTEDADDCLRAGADIDIETTEVHFGHVIDGWICVGS